MKRAQSVTSKLLTGVVGCFSLFCLISDRAEAQTNYLSNSGFESGVANGLWSTSVVDWTGSPSSGGELVNGGGSESHGGVNYVRVKVAGGGNKLLQQRVPMSGGQVYEASGWMRTDTGTNAFNPTNGYAAVVLQFYDIDGIKLGANVEPVRFVATNATTTWTQFGTGPALAPPGTVSGRILAVYSGQGDTPASGFVRFDDLRAFPSAPTTNGALKNPDFEMQPLGTMADTNIPYWTALGNVGQVTNGRPRSGRFGLEIGYIGQLVAQTWPAVAGSRYVSDGYGNIGRLHTTNFGAGVIMEFFNATGGVVGTYTSQIITNGSPTNSWIYLRAEGIAPPGTVTGRTLVGTFGSDLSTTNTIYFDDIGQSVSAVTTTFCGVAKNPGWDDGLTGNAFDLSSNNLITGWTWVGGNNAGFIQSTTKRDGPQALAITFPQNLMQQNFTTPTGMTHIIEGYIYNPSSERITNGAYGTYLLEYYSGTNLISVVDAGLFTASNSTADTWTKFSVTNWAPNSGTVSGRLSATILGATTNFGGALYFDTTCITATNIARSNSSSGPLLNPGFEFSANGTRLPYVDNWTNLGFDGAVAGTYARSGQHSLRIYFTETLAGQTWNATGLYRYSTTAYAFTPPGADRLAGHSNLQAVLVMEFYNATNGLLTSYASNPFGTNAAAGVWSNLTASGIAPAGTVRARTLIGIVGSTTGFAGSVYFDDVSHTIVSTGGTTTCGLIINPGFDDGVPGDVGILDSTGQLPGWDWLGGATNGGFIATDHFYDGYQALVIPYPHQLAVQTFPAQTAMSYKVEGRIFNPSSAKLQGTTYATLLLQFMIGTNPVATKESAKFLTNSPVDTWVYFAVTSRAPINATGLSGRVACFLQGDESGDSNFAGAVYFDGLCVTATNIPYTTTTNGALKNPGFEDSSCGTLLTGIDNWIALGDAGAVDCTIARTGGNSLNIYFPGTLVQQDWAATPGDKYASSGYVYSSSSAPLLGNTNELLALVIQQFVNATGGVIISYVSNPYGVTNAENTWVSLYAAGVAPQGTVSGRTLVGLVGTNAGFSGSVYFDDIGQSTIWTTAPVYSLLRNAGYDDGPPGNADALQLSGDLPNWTWLGGTNAGFVQRSFRSNEEQALAITYPNNLMAQTFTVSGTGANLMTNPGFELGAAGGAAPDSWFTYGEAGQESWAAETGTNGVAFRGWVTNGFGGFGQDVPVNNALGNIYTFSIRGNAEANFQSSSQETWIKLEFWKQGEGSYRYLVSNSIYTVLTSNPGTWQTFTVTVTNTDPQIDLIKPVIGFGNATAPGGSQACRWDNATMLQSSGTGNGSTYVLEGYIFNPGTERLGGTAYGTFLLEFFNNATDLVSVVDAGRFVSNSPANTWVKFAVTNRAPWSGNISGRASAALLGNETNFAGALYFDALRLTSTNIGATNASCGAIQNPGFEYTAKGTQLKYVDNWIALGNAGDVQDTFARTGNRSLHLYFTETLAAQDWNATGLYRYATTAYAFTPSTDRFAGHSNLQAVLVMEFYNATNGLLISYTSNPFRTNAPANVWSNLTVSGMAPNGTVRGRTIVGIVGSVTGYAGSVYFDDICQSIVSTGGTTSCGLIQNPGFDDGVPGDIGLLQSSGDLPGWQWLGGATNGGFIQTDVKYDGFQSLVIPYPDQLAVQTFPAQTGMSYIVSGRILQTTALRLGGSTSDASFLLQFFNGTNLVSTRQSALFTSNSPLDTWTYFSVTGRAPASGSITGRVAAYFHGNNHGNTGFTGAVYFDGVCVTATNIPFTNTVNGAIKNPGFEDSGCGTLLAGIDNWIALGDAGAVDCTIARSGANSLNIYFPGTLVQQDWAATPGDKYASSGFVYSSSSAPLLGDTNNLLALVIQQFVDSTGGVLISYASNPFVVTNAENTWVSLYAIGVAPQGTVSGRTLVGLVGTNAGFSGSVYFDDIGQSVIWTQAPVTSLLRNAGYDDGPPGNADALQLSGDLPNWTWLGGTNAGFVQRSFRSNEEQALAITFPNNLMAQVFPVSQGPNLLKNEGFEIGPAGGGSPANWFTYSEASHESWAAETGTNGMSFHGWVPGGFGGFGQDVPVTNALGNIYTFTIRGNAEANFQSTSQETWLKMEFWKVGEGSPRFIASNSIYSALTGAPNTWQTFTLSYTNLDPDINLIKPLVGFGNAAAPGGAQACRWDNATLSQGAGNFNGYTYILEGYIFNPGTERLGGTAYGTYLLEFFNNGTDLVSVVDAGRFVSNSPANTWVKFAVTNRAPASGNIQGRASSALLGETTNFSGALYFDALRLTRTNLPVTNVACGTIFNPGFEYSANGTQLKYIENWEALGNAGDVQSTYARSGQKSLHLYFTETLVGQTWTATPTYVYSSSAYAFTPSTDRFAGNDQLQAVLVMEFLDATNGVIISYTGNAFTTNAPANVWSNLTVAGVAPQGTVRARTLIGIVGTNAGYAGSVYFDDVCQSLVSTGGSSCGVISNPGFDDGIPGNIYALEQSGNLPYWQWLGGTNGGFVQGTFKYDGVNALAITFPDQLAVQTFPAQTGMSYIVSGRIFNPASQRITDAAKGQFLLQFFNGTNLISTKSSPFFTTNNPADTWSYFAVTGRAPSSGSITGRVAAFLQGDGFGNSNFTGAVYFDGICVTATNIPFTNTVNGAIRNPGFEDSGCGTLLAGIDNWIALGDAGAVDCSIARSGANSLNIYFPGTLVQQDWAATPGDKYASSGFVYSSSSAPLLGNTNELLALVIQQFVDATGGVLISYASNPYGVTNAENTWVSLYAIGVAPQGTVSGRTLVGLVGTNAGFSGSVYFDDIGQSVIWTQAPVTSLLRNAGYDDGPPGNADALQLSLDLPNWTWLGGTNAGFVQRSFRSNEEQALAITFPNNLMAQTFPVSLGGDLLKNSGFEIGAGAGGTPSNWFTYGDVGHQWWAAETGTNGMSFNGWVPGGFGGFGQDVTVSPAMGNVYTFTIRGNAEADFRSSTSESWIKIEFWKNGEGSPRFIASNSVYAALTNAPNTWQTFTLTVTNNDPEINLAKPLVGFGNAVGVGAALACRWDNASFRQSSGASNNGQSYVLEGYIFNPGTERLGGVAYGTYLLEFFNEGTDLVSVVDAGRFVSNSPANTWVKFAVTNRAPWTGNISGRASAALLGDVTNFAGALYFDALRLTMTNIGATNAQSGAIFNPGFEYTANGTQLKYVDNWTALGNAGDVQSTYARSGQKSLHFYFTETLVAQNWAATPGWRYGVTAYAFTPTNDRFRGNDQLQAIVALEYLNATGGVIISYASNAFTTNSAAGVWSNLTVSGVAPNGAVQARTLLGVVGTNANYGGSVYFDDVSQYLISTGGTVAGILRNPGFDDGIPGNAAELDASTNFPYWTWLGGTNAGFVQSSFSETTPQALAITFPQNLAAQYFNAQTGYTYIFRGSIYNPSNQRLGGDAFGTLLLEFFQGTNLVSSKSSLNFTTNSPVDTWVPFAVTNRAPWSGPITGRVSVAVLGSTSNFAGALYFDNLRLIETNIPFANTNNGALLNPGFEYSAAGTVLGSIDNWLALGNAGNVDGAISRSGQNSLKIYFPGTLVQQDWAATPGDKYASSGFVYTASTDDLTGDTNTLLALVIQQFIDSTGGVLISYVSNPFTPTNAANQWVSLYAIGVAPQGTVTGRTLVGLVGTNAGFSGSVYFDDIGQQTVWTDAPVYSLVRNAGFDDGPPGNVDALQNSYDLPNWTWLGGTNAGFVQRSFRSNEEQALAITFPNNLMAQVFNVSQGPNLLKNEGFEIGPANGATPSNWFSYGEVGQEWWAAETGTNGMNMRGWVPGGFGGFGQDVRVVNGVGNIYRFSIRGNAEANFQSSSQETWIKMEFWKNGEGSPRFIASNSVYTALTSNPNTWQTFSLTHTNNDPSIDVVKVLVGFGNAAAPGGAQACRWDNASLVQVSPTASTGMSYVLEGYIYNPASEKFQGNAYGTYLMEFYSGTDLYSVVDAGKFTATNSPSNTWVKFSVTNRAPWAGQIYGRASATILGGTSNYAGALYFDSLRLTATNIPIVNTSTGGIFNPGFEYSGKGTVLGHIDNWQALGNAGNIDGSYARSGGNSLKIYFTETLVGQTWAATQGWRYASSAYVSTPTNDRLKGDPALQALVILQYMNNTGGVIISYVSPAFTTNNPAGQWTNLPVSGTAPIGAVTGRTLLGLIGPASNFAGSINFDDVAHWVVSTGTTQSGLLLNPGFDDGPPGNAAFLSGTNLPGWKWLGGNNAGFIVRDYFNTPDQSYVQTYPENYMVQDVQAGSSRVYRLEGYMFTPSVDKFNTDGSAWGELNIQFFVNGSTVPAAGFTKATARFGASRPADQWIQFSVIATSPASAVVTARVSAVVRSTDLSGDFDLTGVIYFDALTLTDITGGGGGGDDIPATSFVIWQALNLPAGRNGANEDYDGDGVDNYSEFVAGTAADDTNSFFEITSHRLLPSGLVEIRWNSVAGRYYSVSRADSLEGKYDLLDSAVPATPPENVFIDETRTGPGFFKVGVGQQ
jgi:hypothetical protein